MKIYIAGSKNIGSTMFPKVETELEKEGHEIVKDLTAADGVFVIRGWINHSIAECFVRKDIEAAVNKEISVFFEEEEEKCQNTRSNCSLAKRLKKRFFRGTKGVSFAK